VYIPVLDTLQKDTHPTCLDAQVLFSVTFDETVNFVLNQSDLKAYPRTDGRNTGYRSRRGVYDKGQLFTGYHEEIQQGTHALTRQKDIGVIVKKDKDTHQEARKLSQSRTRCNDGDITRKAKHSTGALLQDTQLDFEQKVLITYQHAHQTRQEQGKHDHKDMSFVGDGRNNVGIQSSLESILEVAGNDAGPDKDARE